MWKTYKVLTDSSMNISPAASYVNDFGSAPDSGGLSEQSIHRSNTLQHILMALRKVERSGNGYKAQCPAHNDSEPSLSIEEAPDGKILLFCHAGCSTEDVVSELGLTISDLFPSPPLMTHKPRIVKEYDYLDADGSLLFQAVRYAPKDFRQRRPDGNGGWIWNLKGVKAVPYRLPELIKADTVFIPEGEKDCDNLATFGLAATTSPMGAGKWRSDYNQYFARKSVVCLPDNDPPGLEHALKVATQLQGIAGSVKILELPGLPPKGDVSDWLNNGGSGEKLLELAASAQEFDPGQVSVAKPQKRAESPRIEATSHDLPSITAQAWEALTASNNPPRLFNSATGLVRLDQDDSGSVSLHTLDRFELRHILARCARWFEVTKEGGEAPGMPPMWCVDDLLADPEPPLPFINKVVDHPVFASDGSLHLSPGYIPKTKCFYWDKGQEQIPPVSTAPTQEEIVQAKDIIDELLCDFPFTSVAGKAQAFGLFVLFFAREMIAGPTPLHLISAPGPGTGKTLLAQTLASAPIGRALPSLSPGKYEEETRKRLTAVFQGGAEAVLMDNIQRGLQSGELARAITSEVWCDRILGLSETVNLPVRQIWMGTGNNPRLSEELSRRSVEVRLDAKQDRPWLRNTRRFKHPDIIKWARENREKLIWAGLTLVQNWLATGRPQPEEPKSFGMFEGWTEVIGGILDAAEIPDFLGDLDKFYERADWEGGILRSFLDAWWNKHGSSPVKVADLLALIEAAGILLDLGDGSEQSRKVRLGKLLSSHRDRRIDNYEITRAGSEHRAQLWSLVDVISQEAGLGDDESQKETYRRTIEEAREKRIAKEREESNAKQPEKSIEEDPNSIPF